MCIMWKESEKLTWEINGKYTSVGKVGTTDLCKIRVKEGNEDKESTKKTK